MQDKHSLSHTYSNPNPNCQLLFLEVNLALQALVFLPVDLQVQIHFLPAIE